MGAAIQATAKPPAAPANAIRINVVDAAKVSLREFRVIAGVKSGVSSKIENVVNWQPHTLADRPRWHPRLATRQGI